MFYMSLAVCNLPEKQEERVQRKQAAYFELKLCTTFINSARISKQASVNLCKFKFRQACCIIFCIALQTAQR